MIQSWITGIGKQCLPYAKNQINKLGNTCKYISQIDILHNWNYFTSYYFYAFSYHAPVGLWDDAVLACLILPIMTFLKGLYLPQGSGNVLAVNVPWLLMSFFLLCTEIKLFGKENSLILSRFARWYPFELLPH
jgi:hypothetical protein